MLYKMNEDELFEILSEVGLLLETDFDIPESRGRNSIQFDPNKRQHWYRLKRKDKGDNGPTVPVPIHVNDPNPYPLNITIDYILDSGKINFRDKKEKEICYFMTIISAYCIQDFDIIAKYPGTQQEKDASNRVQSVVNQVYYNLGGRDHCSKSEAETILKMMVDERNRNLH